MAENKTLAELVVARPDLPVIAEVSEECVPDDGYSYWFCQFASANIKKFVLLEARYSDGYNMFDKTEIEEEITERFASDGEHDELTDAEFDEAVRQRISELEWQEAIVVSVIPGWEKKIKEETV
jgi:hypothetical protein